MGNFQRGNKNSGFGGARNNNKPQNKPWEKDRVATMHSALCGECGRKCEVPFRPTGEKPVYCNDCFSTMRTGEDRAPRRDFASRPARKEWNDHSAARPNFPRTTTTTDDTKKQLAEINTKLDRLIHTLENLTSQQKTAKEIVYTPTKVTEKKPAKKEIKTAAKDDSKKPVKKDAVKKQKTETSKSTAKKTPSKKTVSKKK